MKTKFALLSLAAGILLLGASCHVNVGNNKLVNWNSDSSTPAAASTSTTTLYQPSDYHFSIQYPSNWTVDTAETDVAVVFLSPFKNSSDTFQENLNIIEKDLSQKNYTNEQFLAMNLAYTPHIQNYKQMAVTDTQIDGSPAKKVVLTGTVNGDNLQFAQFFTLKNKRGYTITCSFTEDAYAEYAPICDAMVASMKLF